MNLTQAPKILILESQMIIAADVSLQISKLGYEVIGINTQLEGILKTIESNRPDIVLMNLKPEETEERIKTAYFILKNFHIPVVFLSAHTDQEIFKKVINAQPYAFISKPFEIKDLQRGLKTALDRMDAEGLCIKPI
jgi:AmiR/NasT family two-component response regulator